MKLRPSLHAVLFLLCLVQGTLSSLAYTHTESIKILVLGISTLLASAHELIVFLCQLRGVRLPWLLPACSVLYTFFLASTLAVLEGISRDLKNKTSSVFSERFQSCSVVMALALFSALFMGMLIPLEFSSKTLHDEDPYGMSSEKTSVDSTSSSAFQSPAENHFTYKLPDLTPMNKQFPGFGTPKRLRSQPGSPIVDMGYVHNPSPPVSLPKNADSGIRRFEEFQTRQQLVLPPLRNKDSEKTLAEYDTDEISVDLLVRASMANDDLYDLDSDNWMGTRADHSQKPLPNKPKESLFSPTGALKIKKLRSKKSLGVLKTDSLPTLQETASNTDLPNEHGSQTESRAYPSENPNVLKENTELVSRESWKSQPEARNLHTMSSSWSLSFIHSPTGNLGNANSLAGSLSPQKSPVLSFPPHESHDPVQDEKSNCSLECALDELAVTQAGPAWKSPEQKSSVRNVSLEYWEANKDSWMSGTHINRPLVYTSSVIDGKSLAGPLDTSEFRVDQALMLNSDDTKLVTSMSAPSLHTYRDVQDVESSHTFTTLEHTLFRPTTPTSEDRVTRMVHHASHRSLGKNQFPYQSQANFSKSEPASQDTSPIRKMIGKLKKSGESSNMHKHSSSLATSMYSSTSGISSKSGSPRKAMKSMFKRALFDQGKRLSFSHSGPSVQTHNKASMFENNGGTFNFGAKEVGSAAGKDDLEKFWESEAAEPESRVSSMPSAIIGEYDKEKWRTLKAMELELDTHTTTN